MYSKKQLCEISGISQRQFDIYYKSGLFDGLCYIVNGKIYAKQKSGICQRIKKAQTRKNDQKNKIHEKGIYFSKYTPVTDLCKQLKTDIKTIRKYIENGNLKHNYFRTYNGKLYVRTTYIKDIAETYLFIRNLPKGLTITEYNQATKGEIYYTISDFCNMYKIHSRLYVVNMIKKGLVASDWYTTIKETVFIKEGFLRDIYKIYIQQFEPIKKQREAAKARREERNELVTPVEFCNLYNYNYDSFRKLYDNKDFPSDLVTRKGRNYYIKKSNIEELKKRLYIGLDLIRVDEILKESNINKNRFYTLSNSGLIRGLTIKKNGFWYVERKNIEKLKSVILK